MEEGSTRSSADQLNDALARKAAVEADVASQQLTAGNRRLEWMRVVTGASGMILALVSVVAGLGSVVGWLANQSQARELRIEERLDRALTQLSAQTPSERVAAISSLKSFLDRGDLDRNTRVVVSVANAVALESDQIVRNAMVFFFEDLDPQVVNRRSQNAALATLIANNRGLMRDRELWITPPGNWYVYATTPEGSRLETLRLASVALLRNGARIDDMSGLYFAASDLSDLDLSRVNFDDTILAWTNFEGATLRGASFNGADLEAVSFVSSDLRDAKLIYEGSNTRRRWSFVEEALEDGNSFSLPNFECADLRGADFSGFPLFNVTRDDVWGRHDFVSSVSFDGANLQGADLSAVSVFYIVERGQSGTESLFGQTGWSTFNEPYIVAIDVMRESQTVSRSGEFTNAINGINFAFSSANIDGAGLPPAFIAVLREPSSLAVSDCAVRAPWRES